MPNPKYYTHSDGEELIFEEIHRCAAKSTRSGKQCKRRKAPGMRTCVRHGSGHPTARDKSARHLAMEQMRRFVTPINPTDTEANPIAAFEMEFRRTIARIRYYDEVLATLEPENLGWGMTKQNDVEASEYAGIDTEYTAQANIYHELQFRERKHLMDMVKVWIGAKLDVRKLEVEEQKVIALNRVIEVVVTNLGHNPHDPEVRKTVRDAMLALPVAGQSVVASAQDIINGKSLVSEAVREAQKR